MYAYPENKVKNKQDVSKEYIDNLEKMELEKLCEGRNDSSQTTKDNLEKIELEKLCEGRNDSSQTTKDNLEKIELEKLCEGRNMADSHNELKNNFDISPVKITSDQKFSTSKVLCEPFQINVAPPLDPKTDDNDEHENDNDQSSISETEDKNNPIHLPRPNNIRKVEKYQHSDYPNPLSRSYLEKPKLEIGLVMNNSYINKSRSNGNGGGSCNEPSYPKSYYEDIFKLDSNYPKFTTPKKKIISHYTEPKATFDECWPGCEGFARPTEEERERHRAWRKQRDAARKERHEAKQHITPLEKILFTHLCIRKNNGKLKYFKYTYAMKINKIKKLIHAPRHFCVFLGERHLNDDMELKGKMLDIVQRHEEEFYVASPSNKLDDDVSNKNISADEKAINDLHVTVKRLFANPQNDIDVNKPTTSFGYMKKVEQVKSSLKSFKKWEPFHRISSKGSLTKIDEEAIDTSEIIKMKYKDRHDFYLDVDYREIFIKFNYWKKYYVDRYPEFSKQFNLSESDYEKLDYEQLADCLTFVSGRKISPEIVRYENESFISNDKVEKNVNSLQNCDKSRQQPQSSKDGEVNQQTIQYEKDNFIELYRDPRCKIIFDTYNASNSYFGVKILATSLSLMIGIPVPLVIAWEQNQKFIKNNNIKVDKPDDFKVASKQEELAGTEIASTSADVAVSPKDQESIEYDAENYGEQMKKVINDLRKYDIYSKVKSNKNNAVVKICLRGSINFDKIIKLKKDIGQFFKRKRSPSLKQKFEILKAPTIANNDITVIFHFYGDLLQVIIDSSLTIKEIKSELENTWYFDQIIFNGKQLEDEKTLMEYDIKNDSKLFCVHSLQAGGSNKVTNKANDMNMEIDDNSIDEVVKPRLNENVEGMEIDEKIPAQSLLGTQINTQVSAAASNASGASDLFSSGIFENVDDPMAQMNYPDVAINFDDEEDINVFMTKNESLQLIAASIEDITSTVLTRAELNEVKNNEFINDHVISVQLYRELILEHEDKILMVLPVFWNNPEAFENWDAEKINVPNRLPTYPIKSTTFEDAIILINIGNGHWSFAILNKASKTCTHYCSLRWKLSDYHEKHVKRICYMLTGFEMNIDRAPTDSYYQQVDGVNCGPLSVILPKRILNKEKLVFDISVVDQWRQMVHDYNIGFLKSLPITQQLIENMDLLSKKSKIIERYELSLPETNNTFEQNMSESKISGILEDSQPTAIIVPPNDQPFQASDFANLDDPDFRLGLSRESLNKIKNGGYIGDGTIIKEIYRTVIRGYEHERLMVMPCNWISRYPFDNWSSNLKDKFRLQTYPQYSSTFKFAIIPIHFGIHWTSAILDKERKECTYMDTLKNPPPADIYLKLKQMCSYLCGSNECEIIYPPSDSFYEQRDGVDCGALCCILIHRYFTGEDMDFTRDMVFAWRRQRYNYYHPITPLVDKPSTPTKTQDEIEILSNDNGKDTINKSNIVTISGHGNSKVNEPPAKKIKSDFSIIVTAADDVHSKDVQKNISILDIFPHLRKNANDIQKEDYKKITSKPIEIRKKLTEAEAMEITQDLLMPENMELSHCSKEKSEQDKIEEKRKYERERKRSQRDRFKSPSVIKSQKEPANNGSKFQAKETLTQTRKSNRFTTQGDNLVSQINLTDYEFLDISKQPINKIRQQFQSALELNKATCGLSKAIQGLLKLTEMKIVLSNDEIQNFIKIIPKNMIEGWKKNSNERKQFLIDRLKFHDSFNLNNHLDLINASTTIKNQITQYKDLQTEDKGLTALGFLMDAINNLDPKLLTAQRINEFMEEILNSMNMLHDIQEVMWKAFMPIKESLRCILHQKIIGSRGTEDYFNRSILGFSFHSIKRKCQSEDIPLITEIFDEVYQNFMNKDETGNYKFIHPGRATTLKSEKSNYMWNYPFEPKIQKDNAENNSKINETSTLMDDTQDEISQQVENEEALKYLKNAIAEENNVNFNNPKANMAADVYFACTRAKMCNEECPQVNQELGEGLYYGIKRITQCTKYDIIPTMAKFELNWFSIINNHAPCFQGLRTLQRILRNIHEIIGIIDKCQKCLAGCNYSLLLKLSSGNIIPKEQRRLLWLNTLTPSPLQTEQAAEKEYGKLLKKFEEDDKDVFEKSCQVCQRLTTKSKYSELPVNDKIFQAFEDLVLEVPRMDENNLQVFGICSHCKTYMKNGKIPLYATANGLNVDEMPEEFSDMNAMEWALIKLKRPLMSFTNVQPLSGYNANPLPHMHGTMVHIMNPIEENVSYLANTLPSLPNAQGIVINVRWNPEKSFGKFVRLNKMLNCLKWLEVNNRHYHGITIDPQFHFTNESVFFEKEATQAQLNNLIDLSNAPEKPTLIIDETLAHIDKNANVGGTTLKNYLLQKMNPDNLSKFNEKEMDEECFPEIHLTGCFDWPRQQKLRNADYMTARALHSSRVFALKEYIAWCKSRKDVSAIHGPVSVQFREIKNRVETSDLLRCLNTGNYDVLVDAVSTTPFKSLIGSYDHTMNMRHKLTTMVDYFGSFQIYLTLNPAEWDWENLKNAIRSIYKIPNEQEIDVAFWNKKDPYIFAHYFHNRLLKFLRNVILVANGPFGEIIHDFRHYEWQGRGTSHCHMVLWSKEHTTFDGTNEAEVIKKIDSTITVRIPDPVNEPKGYRYVMKNQVHRCTESCIKPRKIKNVTHQICRYGFSHEPSPYTYLNQKDGKFEIQPGKNIKEYFLRRSDEEININAYNMAVLLGWQGNVDIQMICSSDMNDIINYITSYISKQETARKNQQEFSEMLAAGLTAGIMMSVAFRFLNARLIGLIEVAHHILQQPTYQASCGGEFLPADPANKRRKRVNPFIKLGEATAENVYQATLINNHYPDRPKVLHPFSLFNIKTMFDIEIKRNNRLKDINVDDLLDMDEDDTFSTKDYLDPESQDENSGGEEETQILKKKLLATDKNSTAPIGTQGSKETENKCLENSNEVIMNKIDEKSHDSLMEIEKEGSLMPLQDISQQPSMNIFEQIHNENLVDQIRIFRNLYENNRTDVNQDVADEHVDFMIRCIYESMTNSNVAVYLPTGFFAEYEPNFLLNHNIKKTTKILFPFVVGYHWCMFVYDINQNEIHHIDPFGNQKSFSSLHDQIMRKLILNINGQIPNPTKSYPKFNACFVQKNDDTINCGAYIIAYCEYLIRGLKLEDQRNFNILNYKLRMIQIFNEIMETSAIPMEILNNLPDVINQVQNNSTSNQQKMPSQSKADKKETEVLKHKLNTQQNYQPTKKELQKQNVYGGNPFLKSNYHVFNEESPVFCHNKMTEKLIPIINSTVKFVKRSKPVVVRFYIPIINEEDEITMEDFYHRLCLIFKPWVNEADISPLNGSYANLWNDYFTNLRENNPEAAADIDRLIMSKQKRLKVQLENATNRRMYELLEEQDCDIDPFDDQEFQKIVVPLSTKKIDKKKLDEDIANLNEKQKSIFDNATKKIKQQEEWKPESKTAQPDQILEYISGLAGTGKSKLVHTLASNLFYENQVAGTNYDSPPVILAAPTALAAILIGGNTIHHTLGITRESVNHKPMSKSTASKLNLLFAKCKLLIIDEVSMVGSSLLARISLRLQEITGCDKKPFGGINVILLGDLCQLPPVLDGQVFTEITQKQADRYFNHMGAGINLWRYFNYNELTENMRQKDDLKYAQILENFRIGCATEENFKELEAQLIPQAKISPMTMDDMAKYYIDLLKRDPKALALFPRKLDGAAFNNAVMNRLGLQVITITADDSNPKLKTSENQSKPWQKNVNSKKFDFTTKLKNDVAKNNDIQKLDGNNNKENVGENSIEEDDEKTLRKQLGSKTAALPEILKVAIGCRVMLRNNIDVARGLVNGAIGYLRDIKCTFRPHMDDKNRVHEDTLMVEFDHLPGQLIPISRETAVYHTDKTNSKQVTRRQFPVQVAYACTIHKAQGCTCNNVLLFLKDCFAGGQAYVALSRVKNLKGLHLAYFERRCMMVNKEAVKEYNRLRTLNNMPLLPQPPSNIPKTTSNIQPPQANELAKAVAAPHSFPPKPAMGTIHQDHEGEILKLSLVNGDRFLSFANSSLQILRQIPEFMEFLKKHPNDNEIITELSSIYLALGTNRTPDATKLKQLFTREQEEADPWDFIQWICDNCNDEFKNQFLFNISDYYICDNCKMKTRHDIPNFMVLELPLAKESTKPKTFNEVLELLKHRQNNILCRKCNILGLHNVERTISWPLTNKERYLFVKLERYNENNGIVNEANIKGHKAHHQSILKKSWTLIGAIQQPYSSKTIGNFYAWLRDTVNGKQAFQNIKDETSKKMNKIPDNLHRIYLLLYKEYKK